jgi:hypothetical protein
MYNPLCIIIILTLLKKNYPNYLKYRLINYMINFKTASQHKMYFAPIFQACCVLALGLTLSPSIVRNKKFWLKCGFQRTVIKKRANKKQNLLLRFRRIESNTNWFHFFSFSSEILKKEPFPYRIDTQRGVLPFFPYRMQSTK